MSRPASKAFLKALRASLQTRHVTTIENRGTDCIWMCTCRRQARHQLPYHLTTRNAAAHERKYNSLARSETT